MAADSGVIIRTLVVLLALLIVTRILGRRTLSELTFYDFVVGLVLGNIGGTMITDRGFSLASGTVALAAATLWVLGINMLTLKSVPARKLIEAEPLLVISRGHILEENLRKRYYNVNDLLEMLREQGTFDPGEVEAALIEADGQLSVLKKPPYQTPTRRDFNLRAQPRTAAGQPAGKEVIIDGRVSEQGLAASGLSLAELETQLQTMGITSTDEVLVALITPDGKLYADKRRAAANKKSQTEPSG